MTNEQIIQAIKDFNKEIKGTLGLGKEVFLSFDFKVYERHSCESYGHSVEIEITENYKDGFFSPVKKLRITAGVSEKFGLEY